MNNIEKKIQKFVKPLFEKYPNIEQAWAHIYEDFGFDTEGDFGINKKHWSNLFDDKPSNIFEHLEEIEESLLVDQFQSVRKQCSKKIKEIHSLVKKCAKEEELKICNEFWKAIEEPFNNLLPEIQKKYPWHHIDSLYLEIKRKGKTIDVHLYEFKNYKGILDYE